MHRRWVWVSLLFLPLLFLGQLASAADQDLITLFPIEHYDQKFSHWIKANDSQQLLLTKNQQKVLMDELYWHYYSGDAKAMSPWSPDYINKIYSFSAPSNLYAVIQAILVKLSNENKAADKIGYGANFRPLPNSWIKKLSDKINVSQFKASLQYTPSHRAIAVENLNARILPTDEVHFYHFTIPGQGYPFDNLQASAVWAGTPVYILGETIDHDWYLILTPDYYISWVKSTGIAKVSEQFVKDWRQKAHQQLTAITQTETPVLDDKNHRFRFTGYLGMIFPMDKSDAKNIRILIPMADEQGNARIRYATLSHTQAEKMPIPATLQHVSKLINQNLNRPYGWGNQYFYNDCSAETKNFLVNFGIWVPRHSEYQVDSKKVMGQAIDLSGKKIDERIQMLQSYGHPFFTVIYIGHHVMLYLGNRTNSNDNQVVPLLYENMWGVGQKPSVGRVVVGESVLFPLLKSFPENSHYVSQADALLFKLINLDVLPENLKQYRQYEFDNLDMLALMSP